MGGEANKRNATVILNKHKENGCFAGSTTQAKQVRKTIRNFPNELERLLPIGFKLPSLCEQPKKHKESNPLRRIVSKKKDYKQFSEELRTLC